MASPHRSPLRKVLATLAVAAALIGVVQFLLWREVDAVAEDRHTALAQAFANALWPRLAPLVDGRTATAGELRDLAHSTGLDAAVFGQMRDTPVSQIRFYATDGRILFSTDETQIGNRPPASPALRAALGGLPGNDFRAAVLTTTLPIFDERTRQAAAVIEIDGDVSDLAQRAARTRLLLIATVVTLLGLLHGLHGRLGRTATVGTPSREEATTGVADGDSLAAANASLRREIEERHAAEKRLQLASTVFDNTIEGITITDADQKILAVNRAFTTITGYAADEVIGRTPRILSSGQHDAAFYAELWASLTTHGRWQGEIWNRRKNGAVFPEWLSISAIRDSGGAVSYYVAVFSDISAMKDSQAKLEILTNHDLLTGLPNRSAFTTGVDHAIAHAHRSASRLAVLILDLDHFQHVTDTLGHQVGDQVLHLVATTLQSRLNEDDTLARLGGDEFSVLLENVVDPSDVARQAKQLLSAFDSPLRVGDHELFITASIGIALYPDDGADVDSIVKHADTAMSQAKTHGRNAFHFYEPAMTAVAVERLNTESMLRRCVANGELRLHFQPQVDLVSGAIVGAEALVRWQHPDKGLLPPLKFIPIAEQSGQISTIGAWVLRESCRQFAAWHADQLPLPRVAVNVSAKQLERGDFVDLVRATLEEFSLPPACLEIELTESAIMNTDNAFEVLEELRRLGVELAIDDFGTGHSSLSLLKRLPIGKLKIDRSFITEIAHDPQDLAIVRSVIALAATMDLSTVAEGVDHPTQIVFLKEEGCAQIQGFIVSEPLPPEKMTALLVARADRQTPPGPVAGGANS